MKRNVFLRYNCNVAGRDRPLFPGATTVRSVILPYKKTTDGARN
jgi:hypothetical protein